MKLRNKKTGKIQTCDMVVITDEPIDGEIARLNRHTFLFRSIEQFNDEYEAYKPKEPLIKDEKIRKAVRAWANSFDDVDEIKASDDYKDFWIDGYLIEFERSFNEVESGHTYRRTNIAELCGEATDET